MECTSVSFCLTIILVFGFYLGFTFVRYFVNINNCWGESFDNISYKCATFNSSVKTCDIQLRENCSETLNMEYSLVVAYMNWNTFTQFPIIIIGSMISWAACWGLDMEKHAAYMVTLIALLSEAMQFSNYVLILTLVGPANGFWAANTTTSFRVLAITDGILTGTNLALVMRPDDSGMCCVIMARVLLGDFVVATNRADIPSTTIQPPCKECMTTVCKGNPDNPHPRFDAVIYTGGLFKEFVVYDNWKAYPEFIIFYKRL